jgi:PAS domain S-box-containing protein
MVKGGDPDHAELVREIEALQRANEELARERDEYRQRYDQLPLACATLDAAGNVIEGNRALAALLHLPADALVGASLEAAIAAPQHVQRFRDHLVAVFMSEAAHGCELWLRRPDGGVTRVRIESSALREPAPGRCRSVIFEVSLPGAQARSASSREHPSPSSVPPPRSAASKDGADADSDASTPRATILVIEDESLVRKAVQHYLSRAGYRVLTAVDGPRALERSAQHEGAIDLILTDLSLPDGGTGPDVAQRIQQQRPNARVLYMTACPPELLARRGFSVTPDETLEKPFGKDALLARVADELARTAARPPAIESGDGSAPSGGDGAAR